MDPNKALANIRAIIREIHRTSTTHETCELADELAWIINDLDQWIRNGGFLPTDWNQKEVSA